MHGQLEALEIKVVNKRLSHVEKDRESVPRSGWVDVELDAPNEEDARGGVVGALKRCGAQGAIKDVSPAPPTEAR